jgi:hypothetical protein
MASTAAGPLDGCAVLRRNKNLTASSAVGLGQVRASILAHMPAKGNQPPPDFRQRIAHFICVASVVASKMAAWAHHEQNRKTSLVQAMFSIAGRDCSRMARALLPVPAGAFIAALAVKAIRRWIMRTIILPQLVCRIMPARDNVFALLLDATDWRGRGRRQSLIPHFPSGDPLEVAQLEATRLKENGGLVDPQEEPPNRRPPSLPDFPTDVPANEPHDVPAWEPVDDPPPDTSDPQPKPRPIPEF